MEGASALMNNILKARLILLKYNWIHVLFWLIFPLIFTFTINYLVLTAEKDAKLPIAIIQEEDTEGARNLTEAIKTTDYLRVVDMDKIQALNQLKKNELEAVFVIKSGYERQIERGGRDKLVEAYESDLSFAFIPITETITSYIQQDASRSKAFYELTNLNAKYNQETPINLSEYIQLSKEKEASENLLETSLVYNDSNPTKTKESLIKPLSIWLISYVIAAFLLFDWVIKESTDQVVRRFPFLKVSYKRYLLYNLAFYNVVILIANLVSLTLLDIKIPLLALIAFQFTLNNFIFFIATRFKQTLTYYAFVIGVVLLVTVASGLFIPIDYLVSHLPFIDLLNPFSLMLQNKVYYLGVIISTLLLFIWSIRKGQSNA